MRHTGGCAKIHHKNYNLAGGLFMKAFPLCHTGKTGMGPADVIPSPDVTEGVGCETKAFDAHALEGGETKTDPVCPPAGGELPLHIREAENTLAVLVAANGSPSIASG